MVLDAKDRQLAMSHAFDGAVVQIDVGDFHLFRQRVRIHSEPMILRRDRDLARPQILHRLIPAAMPEFQLEGPSAHGEPKNLMAKANPEDWFFTKQSAERFV